MGGDGCLAPATPVFIRSDIRGRPSAQQCLAGCPCAGGIQLLDLQTLTALRNDESVIRWGLSRMARYQKLSDELIVPNLDQDISFFYDPATKKLRKRFEIYPEALQATVKFANDLEHTHTELLKRIQAERQIHR